MGKAVDVAVDKKALGILPINDHITLEKRVYLELRRVIIEGALRPGDRLSINSMAKQFGVSRLPVIHAIRTLASEGFVQINPHRNAIVTNPTAKDVRTRSLMLIALEEIAVREAWPLTAGQLARMLAFHADWLRAMEAGQPDAELDWHFHEVAWSAPEVLQLQSTIQTLWDLGAYYRTLLINRPNVNLQRIAEHSSIAEAFLQASPEAAIERVRRHRLNSLDRITQIILALAEGSETPAAAPAG